MSVIVSGNVAIQKKNEQPKEAKEVAEQPEEAVEAEQPEEATAKPKKGKKT